MKTIIAGSRDLIPEIRSSDAETRHQAMERGIALVEEAVRASGYEVTEVVSGGAAGADTFGELYALRHNVPLKRFPVSELDWKRNPRGAGIERNTKMAQYGEAAIILWNGTSTGSKNMIKQAREHRRLVYVYLVEKGLIAGNHYKEE